jgi:hypothetical protein
VKKIVITLILSSLACIGIYAETEKTQFGYVQRYDRGYEGDDYGERIAVIEGRLVQNRGGVPY